MANLQECLLQNSVRPPTLNRRRRRRNKGRKANKSLNNSIIHEYTKQRSLTGNANNNLSRPDTPGASTVKVAPMGSTLKSLIDKSSYTSVIEKPAVEQSMEKITASQSLEKPPVNVTIDLCSDESSNETFNCTYSGGDKLCVISQQNENMIDLSVDVADENEVIILPVDKGKSESKCPVIAHHENKSETKRPVITPHEDKPPETKCPVITPHKNKPETKRPVITPHENKPPETKCPDITPHKNKPPESKCPVITPHKNKPESKHPVITPHKNKPPESNSPHITPHENKLPDTQSSNAKPASNRPCKSSLLHSRPEDKSPLSKSPEKKLCCIIPPENEQPIGSSPPANKSETIVIDISDDGNEGNLALSNKNDTNDEILVIGTFNKTSKPSVEPPKRVHKKILVKVINNKPKRICKEHPMNVATEHPRNVATECPRDVASERSRNVATECPRDVATERSRNVSTERSRNVSTERPKENPTQGPSTTVGRNGGLSFAEPSGENSNPNIVRLRRRIKAKYFKKLLQYKNKMEVDLFDTIKYQHLLVNNTLSGTELSSRIGGNVYISAPVYIPSSGLRPIMIDGSNVAFTPENQFKFSCKRLEICIKYFKEKGHKVTAFVPQFRVQSNQCDNPGLLDQLVRSGDVVLTPSKVIDGKLIVPYDDRFIVQAAVLKGGVIISRDNYKDLLEENPTWAETIKYRTLAYTWVDDVLMFPSDPLGVVGPTLEEFLRFD